jgi:hypothetical protein
MDSVPKLAIICAVLLVTVSGAAQNAPPVNDVRTHMRSSGTGHNCRKVAF